MDKRLKIISVVVIVSLIVSLGYFFLAEGSVFVNASYVDYLKNYDNPYFKDFAVDVFIGDTKIGQNNQYLRLPLGKHTLRFGDFNSDFETPGNIEVNVNAFQTTTVEINYLAKFGVLKISCRMKDPISDTNVPATEAVVYVDGEANSGSGIIIKKIEPENLGEHWISFGHIDGYKTPYVGAVNVEKGQLKTVDGTYNKILTQDQEQYLWYESRISYPTAIDTGSNMVFDQYRDWALENRVRIPICYYEVTSTRIDFHIVRYGGVLTDDKIDALRQVYEGLISVGIDLKTEGSIKWYSYSGKDEWLLEVDITNRLDSVSIDGRFRQFDKDQLSYIPNLFPRIIPVGISYFYNGEVFCKLLGETNPVYVAYPSFREYSSHDIENAGFYQIYDSMSLSSLTDYYFSDAFSQIRSVIEAGLMGSVLLNPINFCGSLFW